MKPWTVQDLDLAPRELYTEDHVDFRRKFKAWIAGEKLASKLVDWETQGHVDKTVFVSAMNAGFYLPGIPKEFGGHGLTDFRYNSIIAEELEYHNLGSVFLPLGNDIVLPYFTHISTPEQRQRWLPEITANGSIISICMSEAMAGSDLQNVSTKAVYAEKAETWSISGRKLWISSGTIADLHIVVCVTGDTTKLPVHKCLSLFVVRSTDPGFKVTKTLDKLGRHAQDTSSLQFTNVVVDSTRLLGELNKGFQHLMTNLPQERLGIAVAASAGVHSVLLSTINYVQYRAVFKRKVADFQFPALTIANFIAQANVLQLAVDAAIVLHLKGKCTTQLASALKQQATTLYASIAAECVIFFGGVGYLRTNPVGNHFVDSRVTTIYGGSNHIMLEIIARKFGFDRAPAPVTTQPVVVVVATPSEEDQAKLAVLVHAKL